MNAALNTEGFAAWLVHTSIKRNYDRGKKGLNGHVPCLNRAGRDRISMLTNLTETNRVLQPSPNSASTPRLHKPSFSQAEPSGNADEIIESSEPPMRQTEGTAPNRQIWDPFWKN